MGVPAVQAASISVQVRHHNRFNPLRILQISTNLNNVHQRWLIQGLLERLSLPRYNHQYPRPPHRPKIQKTTLKPIKLTINHQIILTEHGCIITQDINIDELESCEWGEGKEKAREKC